MKSNKINKFQKTNYGYYFYFVDNKWDKVLINYIFTKKWLLSALKNIEKSLPIDKQFREFYLTQNISKSYIIQIGHRIQDKPQIKEFDTLKEAKNYIKEYIVLMEI